MGEGADRVNGAREEAVGRVEGEIDSLRGELTGLVAELDRRRHEAFDVRLQLERHPIAAALAAAAAALIVGSAIAVVVRERRERRRPSVRAREARRALARLIDHPDRVAAEPGVAMRVATAALTVAATALVKRLIDARVAPPRR
jgi:UDP-N-acetylmuramyl pentapeptide synthase